MASRRPTFAPVRSPNLRPPRLGLAFFAVFLLYPLGYVIPGAASDETEDVRLIAFGPSPAEKASALLILSISREGGS